jgi:hypothetical protein
MKASKTSVCGRVVGEVFGGFGSTICTADNREVFGQVTAIREVQLLKDADSDLSGRDSVL